MKLPPSCPRILDYSHLVTSKAIRASKSGFSFMSKCDAGYIKFVGYPERHGGAD